MPHETPLHVAVPFHGAEQGVHEVPQLSGLKSLTQVLPQAWKPVSHREPQISPSHVAVPFVGTGQGEQDSPQVSTEVLETHETPQRWVPLAHRHVCVASSHAPGCGHCASLAQPGRHSFVSGSQ